MRALLRKGLGAFFGFWFESDGIAQLRVFRFLSALTLFFFYAIRTFDLELLFSDNGVLPLAVVHDLNVPMDYRYSLLFWLPSMTWVWIFHIGLLGSLLLLALGRWSRICALVALVLQVSFIHRNVTHIFGVDLIGTFFLFYLAMARGDGGGGLFEKALTSMAYRFAQIQICVIYAYAGLEKVRGLPWWSGDAIWGVLANPQLARWDFTWASDFRVMIAFATFSTLAWEIYFPFAVWTRKLRLWWLAFGVALHIGIGVVVNIPFFSLLMITSYVLFLSREEIERLNQAFGSMMMLSIKRVLPRKAAVAKR